MAKNSEIKEIIPVVICTDHNYAKFASVTIQSIKENCSLSGCEYHIFVFGDEELLSEDKRILESMSEGNCLVKTIDVSGMMQKDKLYSRAHYSKQMFYRWLIPEVLPEYPKTIYIDCDLVVLCDIKEFLSLDLEGCPIGAIKDMVEKDRVFYYIEKDLGLNKEYYINSGVFLIDNQKFNDMRVKENCLEVLEKHSVFSCPDQDAINIVLKDKIKLLPLMWNLQWGNVDLDNFDEDCEDLKIIHYTGAIKPWKKSGKNLPLAKHFWKYAKNCPFFEEISSVTAKSKNEKVRKVKRNKFTRFFTFPFRMVKKFFSCWRDVGFRNAMHEVFFELKYVFHRLFGKK